MKNLKLAALAIALVGTFGAGNALAADSATLDVTANVIETCRFDSDGGTLNFGDLDVLNPVDKLNVAPTANPFFTCSAGTVYAITDNSGSSPLTKGVETIAYTLAYTAGGTATGVSQQLAILGNLPQANFAGKSAGTYNATVTFSITP